MTFNRVGVVLAARIFASGVIDNRVVIRQAKILIRQMAVNRDLSSRRDVFKNDRWMEYRTEAICFSVSLNLLGAAIEQRRNQRLGYHVRSYLVHARSPRHRRSIEPMGEQH